jgi:hypothetical protein
MAALNSRHEPEFSASSAFSALKPLTFPNVLSASLRHRSLTSSSQPFPPKASAVAVKYPATGPLRSRSVLGSPAGKRVPPRSPDRHAPRSRRPPASSGLVFFVVARMSGSSRTSAPASRSRRAIRNSPFSSSTCTPAIRSRFGTFHRCTPLTDRFPFACSPPVIVTAADISQPSRAALVPRNGRG